MSNINGHPIVLNENILLLTGETASLGSIPSISVKINEAAAQGMTSQSVPNGFSVSIDGFSPGLGMNNIFDATVAGVKYAVRIQASRAAEFQNPNRALYHVHVFVRRA